MIRIPVKSLLLAFSLLVSASAAFAQSDYDVSKDKENGSVVYKGQMTFADLEKESDFAWFTRGSKAYVPDSVTVAYLKKQLPNYEIIVLMGTWCEDSQNLVPKLHKVLQAAGYPMEKYTMYGVDRAKTAKYVEHKLYKVEKVPTIILSKDHNEVGRIVETLTKKNIESDLAAIIRKNAESEKAQ